MSKSKYHRRADGLLETTRTDKRTGKRVHFYGHTDREIEDQIMAFRSAELRGRSFQEVAEEWQSAHFPTLSPNSLRNYRPAYARALAEFADCPIRKITAPQIKRFLTDFSRGGMARKTVGTQLLILHLIFSYAVEAGDLDYSPCDHISIPKSLTKTPRDAASPNDEAIIKASPKLWLFPFLILYTGLRKGEALALRYEDFDFDAGEIHITKSVYHDPTLPKIKKPKSAAGVRCVPLLDPLRAALPKHWQGYLFSLDGGKTPLTEPQYARLWAKYASATGISCTAHQLRHSYATMLYDYGIELKDAQDILGHSTAAMTQDLYTHIRDSRRKQTAKTLNEKIKAAESGGNS